MQIKSFTPAAVSARRHASAGLRHSVRATAAVRVPRLLPPGLPPPRLARIVGVARQIRLGEVRSENAKHAREILVATAGKYEAAERPAGNDC